MSNPRTAVYDPIFFLLHSNVDRLWARWQLSKKRFGESARDYSPSGKYDPNGRFLLGHYLEDTMWPWDKLTGNIVEGDLKTRRPPVAPGGDFPQLNSLVKLGPPARPRPLDLIDYLGTVGGLPLGFAYDDVPFSE